MFWIIAALYVLLMIWSFREILRVTLIYGGLDRRDIVSTIFLALFWPVGILLAWFSLGGPSWSWWRDWPSNAWNDRIERWVIGRGLTGYDKTEEEYDKDIFER